MKKLLVPVLLSLGTYASAAFLPSTSTLANQGAAGTTPWPVSVNQGTVLGATVTFNGAQPVTITQPTVLGATVAQTTDALLNASVSLKGSSNTVFVSNLSGQTTEQMQIQVSGGVSTPVGYQTNGASVPVQVQNTVTVAGTINVSGLNSVTTTYVVNPTTSPIQIQASGGALTSVGYQTAGASVPVNVLNTVAISGSISANTVNITTGTYGGTFPLNGNAEGFYGPTGLMQAARVDISSNLMANVNGSTVAVTDQGLANVTGTLQSASMIVASTFTPVYNTATFTIWPGTATGLVAVFEGSVDNATSWQGIYATQEGAGVVVSTFTVGLTTTSWETNITGLTNFRVRATKWTAGFSSVTIHISALPIVSLSAESIVPYTAFFSSYSAIVSSTTYGVGGPISVLISSTGVNTSAYIYSCWCVNTTATNNMIRIASPVNATTTVAGTSMVKDIGCPANYVMGGIVKEQYNPWFKSPANTSVSITQTAVSSSQSISIQCDWFVQ